MKRISVIIPIFYGRKYISKLINKIEINQNKLKNKAQLEIIFVNDSPDDGEIEEYIDVKNLEVTVIEHKNNEGIHKSRVDGLKNSTGEYVCFLDQDDEISDAYFLSQLGVMRKTDVVVCNGKFSGNLIFANHKQFSERVSRDSFVRNGNYIISTGQTLIRKKKIPDLWLTTRLSHNGADDYFLWLAMMNGKCTFSYNASVLYFHRMVDNNTSSNLQEMYLSIREMADILLNNNYISRVEKNIINRVHEEQYCFEEGSDDKLQRKRKEFNLLMTWKKNDIKGLSISEYLKEKGFRSVVIYGGGNLGQLLMLELIQIGVKVSAIIDKKDIEIDSGIPCVSPDKRESIVEDSDIIIETTLYDYQSVKEKMNELYDVEVISLTRLLYNLDSGLE